MSSRAVIKSLFIGPSGISLFEIHRWRFVARAERAFVCTRKALRMSIRARIARCSSANHNPVGEFKFDLVDAAPLRQ